MYIFILCVCIVFFYGTFTRASTNNLDSATNTTFHTGGVALTIQCCAFPSYKTSSGWNPAFNAYMCTYFAILLSQ